MIREFRNGEPPAEYLPLDFKLITDPAVLEQIRQSSEQFHKNDDWLLAHWNDLVPGVYGKHLVVAGQEAFISDSMEDALARAKAAHPDDMGIISRYVFPPTGPRIYAIRGTVASVARLASFSERSDRHDSRIW